MDTSKVSRICRELNEAAFLRELFDEPATVLYRVSALVRALDEALLTGSNISLDLVHQQVDQLLLSIVESLEGAVELEMVRALLGLRLAPESKAASEEGWEAHLQAARGAALNVVNNFLFEKLSAVPAIQACVEKLEPS